MSDYGNILKGLAVRLVLSAPLFGVGWYLLHTGATPAHSVMFSLPLFLVGALIVGPKLCELLAEPWRSFFYPSKHFDGPQPMYSIPASKRAKGDYEGAIAAYEDIAEKHPKERKPYEGMIDIAVVNLKDRDRADAIYACGLATLRKPEDQEALTEFYRGTITRLDGEPQWLQQHRERTLRTGQEVPDPGVPGAYRPSHLRKEDDS